MLPVVRLLALSFILVLTTVVLAFSRTARTTRAVGLWLHELRHHPEQWEGADNGQRRIGEAVVDLRDWLPADKTLREGRGRWPGS